MFWYLFMAYVFYSYEEYTLMWLMLIAMYVFSGGDDE